MLAEMNSPYGDTKSCDPSSCLINVGASSDYSEDLARIFFKISNQVWKCQSIKLSTSGILFNFGSLLEEASHRILHDIVPWMEDKWIMLPGSIIQLEIRYSQKISTLLFSIARCLSRAATCLNPGHKLSEEGKWASSSDNGAQSSGVSEILG